jgi:ADP-ribose pyrophosphatase
MHRTVARVIEQPPAVVLVVQDGDEIVLVRQYRPGAQLEVLELPAGLMEDGESAVEAADRELAEECGLAVDGWTEIGQFWTAPEYSTEFVRVLAGTVSGEAPGDADEDGQIEVVRIRPDEAFVRLEDAGSVAALGLWMRNYR